MPFYAIHPCDRVVADGRHSLDDAGGFFGILASLAHESLLIRR
jgi:hypothetical protein